jgi:transposase-like protein
MATHLLCASKKGMSSKQLERMLGVTYKTAWFMSHRIRKAMETRSHEPMGGNGGTVELDETFYGRKQGRKVRRGHEHKLVVFSLVERNGDVRSFHVPNVTAKTLKPILQAQVSKDAKIMTDDAGQYRIMDIPKDKHATVNHKQGEYVRGNVHTNTVEGFFSLLKRGLIGTYHHVSEQHLQRYVTEFDFRYSHRETRVKIDGKWQMVGHNDTERATATLKGISGKRLTYRRINA